MELINLTPDDITFFLRRGTRTIPRSGVVAIQCESAHTGRSPVEGIPFRLTEYGVAELPMMTPDRKYIVSLLVAQCAPADRDDLLVVNDPVLNASGQVIGWRALTRVVRQVEKF